MVNKQKYILRLKVAFKGQLDHYTGDDKLLGEQQNENESSYWHQKIMHYSSLVNA